jgi:putative membrane protein
MSILLKWLSLAVSILVSAYFVPGITVAGVWSALVLAIVLGLINLVIKPLILIITLPINILTLGLFTLVINAFLVMLAGTIVQGFHVTGFVAALLFSVLVSIVNSVFSLFIDKK